LGPGKGGVVQQHIKVLGIMFIIRGVLSILLGTAVALLILIGGLFATDTRLMAVLAVVILIVGSIAAVTGILEIAGGWGLLLVKKWSRLLVIIMSIINLIDIPFGTALGIYGLWVLLKPEAEQILTA
jgi:hypothetical protein